MNKFLPYIIILALLGGGYAYMQYNKGHKETTGAKADFVMGPKDLLEAFDTDETSANQKYLDKIIEIEGIVKAFDSTDSGSSLSLEAGSEMSAIICEFESAEAVKNISVGQKVKIKGFCTGKLMDVVLVRCSFVN
ncbi:MAG: hypothetical protein IPJ13_18270 [Saprospiraceae bacterium]|nr:hypothetical protein [Saprospiraceae bacterium]